MSREKGGMLSLDSKQQVYDEVLYVSEGIRRSIAFSIANILSNDFCRVKYD
jgi:hypothetical protein